MNTNVNLNAALGVLAFLGTAGLLLLIGAGFLYALLARRRALLRKALGAGALVCCLYLVLMLAFSLTSTRRALARGEEKHFCEIDCHLAYSLVEVKRQKTLGPPDKTVTARGLFNLITVRTRFDETTISSTRGDSPLYPNSRTLTVFDEEGRAYEPSAEGTRALELSGGAGTPLTTPLRPGQSYTTTLVFDLPVEIRNPTLLMREGEWVTRFIIGHENSPLHGQTLFQLETTRAQPNALSKIILSPGHLLKGFVNAHWRRLWRSTFSRAGANRRMALTRGLREEN
jgi:hypothetical protein